MGKRTRKRGPVEVPRPTSRYSKPERPQAPWHPVPLVELCVLIGLVLIIYGFVSDEPRLLLAGLVLASLGGLDTALREHFNGFKSHTTLIAGFSAVLVAAALYFGRVPWIGLVAGAVLTFALIFWWARNEFMKRSGGVAFR